MGILDVTKWILQKAAVLCLVLVLFQPAASAQEPLELFEKKIKAGLVYNFLKYTAWPDVAANRDLKVCLYGGDSFGGYLNPLDGRTAQQATIVISKTYSIKELGDCHLVFVHWQKKDTLSELLAFLRGKKILTVSDINGFARQGGMVEMAIEQQQIHLYINEEAISLAELSVQDQILKLAKLVPK